MQKRGTCRVCERGACDDGLCSACKSKWDYFRVELEEATTAVCDHERVALLPLVLKLRRQEILLSSLRRHLSSLRRELASPPNEHDEVREWRRCQASLNAGEVLETERLIKRSRRRIQGLLHELREIEARWKSLSARREAILDMLRMA